MRKIFLAAMCFVFAAALMGCGAAKQEDDTAVFRGEIVAINDAVMTVKPLEGYPEAKYAETVNVTIQHMPASPEPMVGDVIEVAYSGIMTEEAPPSPAGVTKIIVVEDAE